MRVIGYEQTSREELVKTMNLGYRVTKLSKVSHLHSGTADAAQQRFMLAMQVTKPYLQRFQYSGKHEIPHPKTCITPSPHDAFFCHVPFKHPSNTWDQPQLARCAERVLLHVSLGNPFRVLVQFSRWAGGSSYIL